MDLVHPSLDITGSQSDLLKGKKIVLCMCGSVAVIKAPELARSLMRHGAIVYPVMSNSACKLIQPALMQWACGNSVITKLSGAIEHVSLAGNVANKADLILVAPATANTIGKMAAGIDDTSVSTVVSTGLGEGIKILMVPAMHQSLYEHPIVKDNLKKLENLGVNILYPFIAEGKAKIASNEKIVEAVLSLCQAKKLLGGRRLLISLGRTIEHLDPIRVITNQSSGKMGAALCLIAKLWGAEVTAVCGKIEVDLPSGIKLVQVKTAAEMYEAVKQELETGSYSAFIAAAAVGDWQAVQVAEQKISTVQHKEYQLKLKATPKIIDQAKDWAPLTQLTAFRAVFNLNRDALLADAKARLKQARANLIVVNDVALPDSGFGSETNEVFVLTAQDEIIHLPKDRKINIAAGILSIVASQFSQAGIKLG